MPPRRAPGDASRQGPGPLPAQVAAQLYALPPDQFVAAREALAGKLSEAHDPLAAAVRRLRRPVGLAWVLDHLARTEHAQVEALLRAGDRLRAGQQAALEGKGAGALRAAEAEVREAARALRLAATPVLAGAGRSAEPAVMGHLEVLLRAVATAPQDVRARFEQGLLEREPEVGGALEAFSGSPLPSAAAPPAVEPGPAAAAEAREASEEESRRRQEELERQQAEEAQAAEAEARERARRLAEARRTLAQAEQRVEETRALAAQRRAHAEAAQRRLDAARTELASAEAELEGAEAEANRARDAVRGIARDASSPEGEAATPPGLQ